MHTEIPAELADVLAAPQLPQRAFPWIRNSWLNQMHDLPETLEMLHHLPERVDRDLVRQIVLAEITRGEVLAAFVAAMVWGWPDPVNWSTANESRSSVGTGGSIAGWW